jgi:outer membrane protein assembly factor BamB
VAAQTSGGAEEPDETTSDPEVETFPTLEELAKHWPRFRGAGGSGIAPFDEAPVSVDPESGKGILWKVKVPLSAPNSPVVWGDRVFLTGANEMKREVYSFDAKSGNLLWQEPVPTRLREPPEVMEDATGFAASTAAVDGKRVFAIFATGDLACFDFQGKRLWMKSYGPLENHYGHASSLLVYRHLLLVLMDQALEDDGKSVLVALDVRSGDVAWEAKRAVDASWITPIVAPTSQGDQVITNASPWVIAHDPLTGAEIWKADCMAGEVAPSPVYADGLVFCVNIDAELVAIRPDGSGDVTDTHIAWYGEDNLPDICSPLATDAFVFLLTSSGRLTCYDAKEGKLLWENKLKIMCNASPSLVGNHIYIFGTKGTFVVAEAAKEFKEVARSELGESVFASPAFQGGRVYVRGQEHLYCLGTP